MTNDEVLDFVRERLNREEKISKICEEVSFESQNHLQPLNHSQFSVFFVFFVFSNFRLGHEIKSEPADG